MFKVFEKLFDVLRETYNITDRQVVPFVDKDKEGKVTSLTLFIPWKLVHSSKVKVSDINPLLPEGWNATESKRNQDMQAALLEGISEPVYSIAINEQSSALEVLSDYLNK